MTNKRLYILILLIILTFTNTVFAVPENVTAEVRTLNIGGVNKAFNVVTIDLNSSDIELEVVTANDLVSGSESFGPMINRKKPIAAINANYFDAYNSLEPYGSIMKNNKFTYLEGRNTSLMIKDKNKLSMDYFSSTIQGFLNGEKENKWNNKTQKMDYNLFTIWYVNNLPTDLGGVYLYTPDRGLDINLNGGTAIEVIGDKVTKITKNAQKTQIPAKGYIIYYGKKAASDEYVGNRFKVGSPVELTYNTNPASVISTNTPKSVEATPKAVGPTVTSKNTKLFGSVDKKVENKWNIAANRMDLNLFNIWYINTNPIDSSGVYLYTPEKGTTLNVPEGKAITVQNKVIKKIELNIKTINIPKDGFVIYYGKDSVSEQYIANRFSVGKTIDFYHEDTLKIDTDNIIKKAVAANPAALIVTEGSNIEGNKIDLNAVDEMISAGPFLVYNGTVIKDFMSIGPKESKISTERAQRSALGITKDNKLVLVTGGNLNMIELSQIMKNLNCENAMNLDGGASSGLFAKGKIITTPGRKLNTVLMIHDKAK